MHFGGIQKNSFIDYPGKISCVLFCSGCNFDCPYCHNPGLVKSCGPTGAHTPEKCVFDFLDRRKSLLDGVVISGGEPTLQKDLFSICSRIKYMGYPVKLDTNGSRPGVLKDLIRERLVDYIAMDLKTDPLKYDSVSRGDCRPEDIIESVGLIMSSDIPHEFRTTCVKPMVTRKIVENISRLIRGARLYALQRFHGGQVLHPEFFSGKISQYSEEELQGLKAAVRDRVRECVIR